MRVVAPGKVFLFGEYAAVEGAPALVMAVTRYARAWKTDEAEGGSIPVILREVAADELPLREKFGLTVDTSDLRAGDRKLGLGSSAASCVAGAAVMFHVARQSLAADTVRQKIFRAARVAHDRLQGEAGSGADIAASVSGGLIRYESTRGGQWRRVHLPAALHLLFVDTGVPASTPELLARVRELRGSRPDQHQRRMKVLGELSAAMCSEPMDHPAGELCLMVHSFAAHLEALGVDAGADIVSEPHRKISDIARSCGCAAKPSGAGGGDLAVVFCPDAASARDARQALAAEFSLVDLEVDPAGVRLEQEEQRVS